MATEQLPRILFNTNLGTWDGGYPLVFDQSLAELAALGDQLRAGLRVTIYMVGELEVEAHLRVEHDPETRALGQAIGAWVAEPIEGTIRHY